MALRREPEFLDLGAVWQPPLQGRKVRLVGPVADPDVFRLAIGSAPERPVRMYRVKDAAMYANEAAIFVGDDVVEQSLYMTSVETVKLPSTPFQRRCVDGCYIVPYNAGWRNYYHFLIQACFASWFFSSYFGALDARFVLPDINEKYRSALRYAVGARVEEVVFVGRHDNVFFAELAFNEITFGKYTYCQSTLLRAFGTQICQRVGAPSEGGRKVYISRRDARNRVMDNELSLETTLSAAGFDIVCLSEHTFEEQVCIMRAADVVMSAHGAGLANIVFCREGARIIELAPPQKYNPCFVSMSTALGLDHEVWNITSGVRGGDGHTFSWSTDVAGVVAQL